MPTYGCFDRRYWAWKLVDYPEATFQRNIYPLSWLLKYYPQNSGFSADLLKQVVLAGLLFSTKIQHKDGAFDQAFPHEHSFGATAFLLHPLITSYSIVKDDCISKDCAQIERCLHQSAEFLYYHRETHGHIANHLAGAVLSLIVSAEFFQDNRYEKRARHILDSILEHQSTEGWFQEYEGADPGYQTLCLYYLAQVYQLRPDISELQDALANSLKFLKWFVHPDGTFGGEYGSRRTAVYYPGGLALLSLFFPDAFNINRIMLTSLENHLTTTVEDIDIGNLAPLMSSYALMLENIGDYPDYSSETEKTLPCLTESTEADFSEAGLSVRATSCYYAVIGTSNGGVLKVFDKKKKQIIWNDGGYGGQLAGGEYITTQITDLKRLTKIGSDFIQLDTPFFQMLHATPTPFQFLVLRILNLTLMRNVRLGNWVKALLVRLLITGKKIIPLHLSRHIQFFDEKVVVTDTLEITKTLQLSWLTCGRPFVGIHMASARYTDNSSLVSTAIDVQPVDIEALNTNGKVTQEVVIEP